MPDDFTFRVLTGENWKDDVSIPLDSGIPGCRWHRIVLDADIPQDCALTVHFSTSEKEDAPPAWSGELVFHGPRITPVMDALINAAPGKYIKLKINFDRGIGEKPVLRQAKIYYQRQSYLRYLPAIYQENRESRDFLDRFLSIFESSMFDSEELISSIPMFFDPEAAPEVFYRWLAEWVSLDLYDLLGEKNREFILRVVEFYKNKGTLPGLVSLVNFLTGKKCCIKEYTNNVFRSWGMEHDNIPDLDEEFRACMNCEGEKNSCIKFFHRTSRTVDTSDPVLLSNMSTDKYCDEVHYVLDTSDEGTYSPHVIGIFIFLPYTESLELDKNQLNKIINSFLPVFVRAKIHIVVQYVEKYDTSMVRDEYYDSVHAYSEEKYDVVERIYEDRTN